MLLVVASRRGRAGREPGGPIQIGMQCLAVGVVIAGVIAAFFFDPAFEVFHELFFPSGSYTFDPATDKLVQLFPFDFWSETTIALGGFILAAGRGRLARRAAAAPAAPRRPSRPAPPGSRTGADGGPVA